MHLDPHEHDSADRDDRRQGAAGRVELRPAERSRTLATGSLACPTCEMPLRLGETVAWGRPVACSFCEEIAPVREFIRAEGWPRVSVIARMGE